MSTAGKVLIPLIMLMALVWIASTAGVDQLNRNGNELLKKLQADVAKKNLDLKKVQHDISLLKDQITVQQERTDRELSRLRAGQTDVEHARSETSELLAEVQLEVANLDHTLKNARLADDRRLAELEDEKKQIASLETELKGLKGTNSKLISRIVDLQKQFQTSYKASLEMVAKSK